MARGQELLTYSWLIPQVAISGIYQKTINSIEKHFISSHLLIIKTSIRVIGYFALTNLIDVFCANKSSSNFYTNFKINFPKELD